MDISTFTLLKNFSACGSYEGIVATDSHGNFILFPPYVSDIISCGDFLKTPSGSTIQIYEQSSEVANGTKMLKFYYK